MPDSSNQDNREHLAFRAPRALAAEIRALAKRDGETSAAILRRLVRTALETERREHSNEAA